MQNNHLGYITSDPKNLGTALKLSARVKLPKLSTDARFSTLLKCYNLNQNYKIVDETQKYNETEEQLNSASSILEISSQVSLGKSEVN
jgi:protein-arginine kinase